MHAIVKGGSTMRRSLLLFALVLSSFSAIAVAQDTASRVLGGSRPRVWSCHFYL